MKLWSDSFADGKPIPTHLAFGRYDPSEHIALCENESPHLAWSEVPAGTKSLALLCHDPDVPSRPDDVNQEGKSVPLDLPRVDFFHWVLVDIDPALGSLAQGEHSDGITAGGKPQEAIRGCRPGLNNYTQWFAGDAEMQGQYFNYDGPCPPWNDELLHHYVFTLYALDLERCPVHGAFDGEQVQKAIVGHVLAEAKLTGTYAIYPKATTRA